MNIPEKLKYTKEHEWVKIEGNIATIGITDFAQDQLGDVVFIELPNIGDEFDQMQTFGTIEAVKAVSDMYLPLSGKITEVNADLDDNPMVINSDPFGQGWMVKIEIKKTAEIELLLSPEDYKKILE